MSDQVQQFYDGMSDIYDLIFEDWKEAAYRQGQILNQSIRSQLAVSNQEKLRLLDCSCGIGTQAIGLAQHHYDITATDSSPLSIERAKKEAALLGVQIQFGVADFRSLEQDVPGQYQVVLSADNAIPHLLSDDDLLLAAHNMYAKLEQDGLLLVTIRDYDQLIKEMPKATQPRLLDQGSRIVFQVWDWAEDHRRYLTTHFILQEQNGSWQTRSHQTPYRALLRDELSETLTKAGFQQVTWHMPEQSGYYQPIVTARRK